MRRCPCGDTFTERREVGLGSNIKTRICSCGLVKEVYKKDKEQVSFERYLDGERTHKSVYNLTSRIIVKSFDKFKQIADAL